MSKKSQYFDMTSYVQLTINQHKKFKMSKIGHSKVCLFLSINIKMMHTNMVYFKR